jgi:hypothetical protein
MTDKEIDELDERRAKVIWDIWQGPVTDADFTRQQREWQAALSSARAIRLSDEAAGYELCKMVEHRGPIR